MVAAETDQVMVSPRAFADFDQILDYIGQSSPGNARRVIDRLWESMHRLKDLPHRYRVVYGRARNGAVRRMPVPPFLVYYRVDEPTRVVRVLTVTHGARRQPRSFGNP